MRIQHLNSLLQSKISIFQQPNCLQKYFGVGNVICILEILSKDH